MNTNLSRSDPEDVAELVRFYESIDAARKRLGISHDPAWFRGHARSDWDLTPSLFRQDYARPVDEVNLYATFVTEGRPHIEDPGDSWHNLALMQHYGVPTRLLDWTDSLHVAIYFAILHEQPVSPCIWVINPFRLNGKQGPRVIFGDAKPLAFDYYPCAGDDCWPFEHPIAVAPSWRNPRQVAQRGYYTIHMLNRAPLNKLLPKYVRRVPIPPRAIPLLLRALEHSGIDEGALFPGLVGLGMRIRRRIGLRAGAIPARRQA